MWRQGIKKFAAVSALGLLVLIFGVILLAVLSPTTPRPAHTDFVFSVTRRTLNVAVVSLSVIIAALIFFLARALRRRNLN